VADVQTTADTCSVRRVGDPFVTELAFHVTGRCFAPRRFADYERAHAPRAFWEVVGGDP
jgi:hypothetical protein